MNKGGSQFLRAAGCALALAGCGCNGPKRDLRLALESPEPVARIHAIGAVVQDRRMDLLPALVDRLDDVDPAVRMMAILGLEKLTGTRLGYDYAAETGPRQDAIEKWRAYAAAQGAADSVEGNAQPAPPPAAGGPPS